MGLCFGYLLSAASAVPLTFSSMIDCAVMLFILLTVVCFFVMDCIVSLLDSCSLRSARILFGLTRRIDILIVNYLVDGRGGVNGFLLRAGWLRVNGRWLNRVHNAAKRGLSVSNTYEILRTCFEFSGEDFQNTGTFIGVRSSAFSVSSAHQVHLARDAYYAC